MISLRARSTEVEIMDDLDCHGEVVDQTLRELEVINRLLGGDSVTLDGIERIIKDEKEIFIADFGCGGGDLAKKIVAWAQKKRLKAKVEGIDANPHIIDFARKNCNGFKDISLKAMDVFLNETKYDIITATLFVHHFTDDQLVELFKAMKQQSRIGVVINDIHRHPFSYHSIKWLTSLFSRSAMVKFDAPLSVRRAFKKQELIDILRKAGIDNYTLTWKWAFRWQLLITN